MVALLKSKNGWIRDRVQQLLVFKQDNPIAIGSVVSELEKLAQDDKNPVTAIHALHTLDGLNALSFDFTQTIAASKDPMLSAHALLLLEKYNTNDNVNSMAKLVKNLLNRKDSIIDLYVALTLGPWAETSDEIFFPVLLQLSQRYSGSGVYQESIVNSLNGLEEKFKTLSKSGHSKNSDELLDNLLATTIKNKQEGKMNSIYIKEKVPVDARTNGLAIFRNTCATCHGNDGDGIEHIAPPLNGSQYVEGSSERLAMIILNGLQGPVHIKGQLYNFNGSMPNFGNNYSDKEIADIISYLHNAFVLSPTDAINAKKIKKLRNKRSGTLTEKDLLALPDPIIIDSKTIGSKTSMTAGKNKQSKKSTIKQSKKSTM